MNVAQPVRSHVYAGRRYACGIIGPASELSRQRLLAFSPPVVTAGGTDPMVEVWLSGVRAPWSESTLVFSTGESTSDPWLEVANRERAGITTNNGITTIFSGALGFDSVYFRPIGRAVAFASEPAPLMQLGDITTNWDAWVDILTIGYPLGADTTSSEVQRLPGASSIVFDTAGWRIEHYRAYWEDIEAFSDPGPEDVADLLQSALSGVPQAGPAVTLSGGWDSRLLAATLMRGRNQPTLNAYTISTDDGFDQDLELVGPVAEKLGMRHHILSQPLSLAATEQSYRRRVFHESWFHTWLEPLATTFRADRRVVVDGLAGDVLFKNLFVTPGAVAEPEPSMRLGHVWAALTGAADLMNREIWTERMAELCLEGGRSRFETAVGRAADHQAGPTLSVLLTRTVRGIALSPNWLFGPECELCTPFTSRPIVEAGLAIPLASKNSGVFYRRLLQAAAPEVAVLPSTNDTPRPPRKDRVSLSARNLAMYGDFIMSSPDAVRLLPAALRGMISEPEAIAADSRRGWWLRVIKGASLLADWQLTWNHRLSDVGSAPW